MMLANVEAPAVDLRFEEASWDGSAVLVGSWQDSRRRPRSRGCYLTTVGVPTECKSRGSI